MIMHNLQRVKLFAGATSKVLGEQVASRLGNRLTNMDVDKFSDGEIRVEINASVRGDKAVVIQSTSACDARSVNDSLMELMIIVDALRRSSTEKIIAVIPYYGYARQDRRPGFTRTPISSRLVADMLEGVGVSEVVTVDLHSLQQVGFFHIPVTNISAMPIITFDIYRHYDMSKVTIVSPDIGGVSRARAVAKELGCELAVIDKRRCGPNVAEVMNIIGNVSGRDCIMIDDMIDTAGTLRGGAQALKDAGATKVVAYATHGVLSGDAYANIGNSCLDEVVVTNTIPRHDPEDSILPESTGVTRLRVLDVSALLAETITRIIQGNSVSQIYVGH